MKRTWLGLMVACLLAAALPASASEPIARYECFGKVARFTKPDPRGVVRGTPGNDVIIVLGRDVVVLGGAGKDRICTGGGKDFVAGAEGHDLVRTGRGNDQIRGGQGLDYLNGAGGDDRLYGGHGHGDTLVGAFGDDTLSGGDDITGVDYLFGGRGDDALVGGNGDFDGDFLVGGEGMDVIDGGTGNDTASFAFSEAGVQVDLAAKTSSADLLTGIENVEGSVFDDLITGDAIPNALHGGGGNDVIAGGAAADEVDGGEGRDSLDGGDGGDTLSFVTSPQAVSADLEAGSVTGETTEPFTGFEHILGSAYDDALSGDVGENQLYGSRGSDALFGREGDDGLDSGSSGDAGPGNDTCWDSGPIANCEQELHGDPAAFSTITDPTQASVIPVAQFTEIAGTASAGAFGPEPRIVEIALRRLSGSGCYWWDVRRAVMRPGHCERPLWIVADFDGGQGTWSLRIPAPVQLLNAGRYQLRSRIRQPGYTERGFNPTYNVVDFRLR